MSFWRSKSRHSQHSDDHVDAFEHKNGDLNSIAAENDLTASANQAAGTEWLAGHPGHLTAEQEEKLVKFKTLVEEKGYYTPAKDGQLASHSEQTLVRFLRARKFDVDGAYKQFSETEDWRKTNHIDELFENINVESFEQARRMYPQWTGRRDRRGIPVYLFQVKHLTSKNISAATSTIAEHGTTPAHKDSSVHARLLCLFALYESLLQYVHPLCSALSRPNPETPVVSSNNIVDISGVSLMQFWNLRGHMQDPSVLSTAHYPETLDRIFIIGAPAFFPTVWGWIKRWFDPVTVSKIFILSHSEVYPTLSSFMEPSSIPRQYGGELDFEFGDFPILDDAARELVGGVELPPADGQTKPGYPKGPIRFSPDKGVELLGTEDDGSSRRVRIPVPQQKKTASTVDGVTAEPKFEEAESPAVNGDDISAQETTVAEETDPNEKLEELETPAEPTTTTTTTTTAAPVA